MNSSILIEPTILTRLTNMAKAAAAKFHGLEECDFLSEAWLGFQKAKESGKSDALAFTHAEFAIKSAMREWMAVEPHQIVVDGDDVQHFLSALPQYSNQTLRTKLPRRLKRALSTLSVQHRRVIYLTYMWNRTNAEIAEQLGIAEGTVASIKNRSLSKLKSELGLIAPRKSNGQPRSVRASGKPMKNAYWFLDPNGVTHHVTHDFKGFCELHGLSYKAMRDVANPNATQKSHQGWTRLTTSV